MKKTVVVSIVLLLCLAFAGIAAAADDIVAAANSYFSGGTKNITAKDLYDTLNDGDDSNDPMIISVRSPEDDEKGRIKGSTTIAIAKLFTQETLATLPKDKKIVVYCYTGQNASWVVGGLRMLGYDAYNLSFGMSGWTKNKDVYVRRFDPATVPNYPTVTEPTVADKTYALPKPLADTTQAALEKWAAQGPKYIAAKDVYSNLNDGDASNDPFIVSVRSAADYAKGHIKGAVNMDVKTLFTADNLAKLPPDKQIVVYCYTGQTSAQVAVALRALGYDAVSLTFGMQGWSSDPNVYVNRFEESKVPDYPVVGSAAAGAPAAVATPATPATLPTTGAAFPVEGVLLTLGAVSVALGAMLRSRKSS